MRFLTLSLCAALLVAPAASFIKTRCARAADLPSRDDNSRVTRLHHRSRSKVRLRADEKAFPFGTIQNDGPLAIQIQNFKVTAIEEISPQNLPRTRYIANGSYAIVREDDKNHSQWVFTVSMLDAGGVVLDKFAFELPSYPCHYNQIPFQAPDYISKNNYFSILSSATLVGTWQHSYEGGC